MCNAGGKARIGRHNRVPVRGEHIHPSRSVDMLVENL